MRRWTSLVLIVALLVGPSRPAHAWNKAGHMVSGAIAYHALKEKDPQALARVIEILEEHPDYPSRWADALDHVNESDRDMVLFMLAARWPDDVRGSNEDRPTHHYVNRPFVPAGQSDVDVPATNEGDIEIAFRSNLDIIRGEQSDREKAKALCWLFHLVGDVHQPLHTSALFTADFPEGDRGGTRFYVKVKPTSDPVSLHQLWDGLIIGSESFQTVRNESITLRTKHPRSSLNQLSGNFADSDFTKWIDNESFPLAKKAYRDGTLKGGTKKSKAKVLPDGYTTDSKAKAEERMVLAGYRLADLLGSAF